MYFNEIVGIVALPMENYSNLSLKQIIKMRFVGRKRKERRIISQFNRNADSPWNLFETVNSCPKKTYRFAETRRKKNIRNNHISNINRKCEKHSNF